jgi:aspartokinase/homoserine dehydrogenase 1
MNLAREQVNILVLGKGTVGSHLLDQIAAEKGPLLKMHDLDLRLTGVADSRRMLFERGGLDPGEAIARLNAGGEPLDTLALLDRLATLPVPVLVDCSSGQGMERLYLEAFARGIHVVAANKAPLALPLGEQQALFAAARLAHRSYRYETTVGASLPVVETLKNLVRTGDRVRLIEGSLSGTLGFLAHELTRGVRLSVAVRDAHARGYTESHPRDDLGGLDAARKALILARELGMPVDLQDVVLEPFVSPSVLAHDDLETFFAALEAEDAAFEQRLGLLHDSGKVLRYLARIVPGDVQAGRAPSIRVGPVGIDDGHPASRLRGTEAFVAFTTERYHQYPLVVQGPGAGGAVTAAGVLADVLALSQSLRGR